jgi:hypothetical protein
VTASSTFNDLRQVIPAIAPVAGLGRVAAAAPAVAAALGYDRAAAPEEPGDR